MYILQFEYFSFNSSNKTQISEGGNCGSKEKDYECSKWKYGGWVKCNHENLYQAWSYTILRNKCDDWNFFFYFFISKSACDFVLPLS